MQCSHDGCTKRGRRRGQCDAHYEAWRSRQHLYGRWESHSLYVDAGPARAHVERLRAAGLGTRRISELAGVRRNRICELYTARNGRPAPSRRVLRTTAERLLSIPLPDEHADVRAPGMVVDAVGTIRRLRALVAAGYPQEQLGKRLGVGASTICDLMHRDRCTVRSRDAVAALFAELQLRPGPSAHARRRGERNGWALPLEWDEDTIDDPEAEPILARRGTPADIAARRREAVELAKSGTHTEVIAHELGVSTRTVERYLAVAS